ncbi:MAG: hypothetical protein WCR42_15475 [bacterium]
MQAMILNSESKSDFKLILEMANKLDVRTTILSDEEIEDFGLANAIKIGETGEYVDVDLYLEKLTK